MDLFSAESGAGIRVGVCYIYKENSVCIARGTEGDPP